MTYLFGNWKMYMTVEESVALTEVLATLKFNASKVTVGVFPNTLVFERVQEMLERSDIALGAQNVSWVPQGAYTGATSAHLFATAGATYALVGHSERRYIFGETNADVRKKLEATLDAGLTAILCIGETKEDVDDGKTEYRLKKQLHEALDGLSVEAGKLIIAYEPVWAISHGGHGVACSAERAAEAHTMIRSLTSEILESSVPVIYGGSVTPDNLAAYLTSSVIDGVLVGHASIYSDNWINMIEMIDS